MQKNTSFTQLRYIRYKFLSATVLYCRSGKGSPLTLKEEDGHTVVRDWRSKSWVNLVFALGRILPDAVFPASFHLKRVVAALQ